MLLFLISGEKSENSDFRKSSLKILISEKAEKHKKASLIYLKSGYKEKEKEKEKAEGLRRRARDRKKGEEWQRQTEQRRERRKDPKA